MKKQSPLMGKNILVVDDEIELRRAIFLDLKRANCHLFEAGNGEDALHIIRENKIDIVLSDIRMPSGDGIYLLKKIRERDPALPVVLLATGGADLTPAEAIKMGALTILEKPINRKLLMSFLEQACKQISSLTLKPAIKGVQNV